MRAAQHLSPQQAAALLAGGHTGGAVVEGLTQIFSEVAATVWKVSTVLL